MASEEHRRRSSPRPKHLKPLCLRRSVSVEEKSHGSTISSIDPSLSSSLHSLCLRLRPHQLLPEFNENIAQASNENEFDWWKSASHLRPLLQNIILYQNFTNEFKDDKGEDNKIYQKFCKSKRYRRRNAICDIVDRLCYNEQATLFSTIAIDLQIESNLISSGFRL
ncbi:unnamed protein product [Adineta ricciae]|uniref:Uncharacterized protein n=1 Tax=Adineta ricciae TaxID=249248 RepID=A0A815PUY2_ADIRI|nr:unnamed protein product [Adineta ricciae]CAF1676874.1 unnamed protein product [Adineta ricciae]